ncbi:MAG TPA: iron ABC transporter permease [Symbiobacteriaceae bacterium]|nr:iron ABC transporter permease [Symbiobacteriaceae bacterium]
MTLSRAIKRQTNSWLVLGLLGAAVILLPLLPILLSLFKAPNENWAQITEYLLTRYLLNSLKLVTLAGLLTVVLGVALAWLVAAYDFPLRRFFRWALLLPLAVPPYIAAYTYSNMFSYTGIVHKTLREGFGITPPHWFGIMSMRGAVFIFTLFLFPYVYMIARSFFERQSGSYIENALLLGRGQWAIFCRVALPLARPAIAGGLALVIFEVLSDYGVTSYYGVHTISTAIFQTWFGMYDVDSAIRLAAYLMLGTVGLMLAERTARRNRRFSASTSKARPLSRRRLHGVWAGAAVLFCGSIFAWGFLFPIAQLITWATWTYADVLTPAFAELVARSVSLALIATAIIMLFATVVANVHRTNANPFTYWLSRWVTAGYSIPGAIVAVGVLACFIGLDRQLAPLYAALGLGKAPLVLSMSLVMLVVAYVVRFMATGYNAVEAGFERVGTKYMEVSRTLGFGMTGTFFKVDLPMVRGALFSGVILTFVEIVKELPLALLLRPFNFETLATRAYQFAHDEKIHEAAVPSLLIIAVSMIAVYVMSQVGKEAQE